MPYHVVRHGSQYCVEHQHTNKSYGCHSSKEKANAQMAAMYANEPSLSRKSAIQVLKTGNPYHDVTGLFTSKEKAQSEQVPVKSSVVSQIPLGGPLRSRITPTEANRDVRTKLTNYMHGFSSGLKNAQERAYVDERVRQMINGEPRPKGMSGKFGLEKRRAIQYEMLTYKIFKAGRKKIGL